METRIIYRVTGGGDPRRVKVRDFVEYGVHPYELVHEVNSVLYTEKDGKKFLFNKSKDVDTPNSQFVYNLDEAYAMVFGRIDLAYASVRDTANAAQDWTPEIEEGCEYLYHIKFRSEKFLCDYFKILGETKKALKIDTRKTREKAIRNVFGRVIEYKTVLVGRSYIYWKNISQPYRPHDPQMPSDEWIETDLITLKDNVAGYASERLYYLNDRLSTLKEEYASLRGKRFE